MVRVEKVTVLQSTKSLWEKVAEKLNLLQSLTPHGRFEEQCSAKQTISQKESGKS